MQFSPCIDCEKKLAINSCTSTDCLDSEPFTLNFKCRFILESAHVINLHFALSFTTISYYSILNFSL